MEHIITEELLYEKMGVWCYSPDVQEYKTTHAALAEKIYTYVRKEIFKNLNNGMNGCVIPVPKELLEIEVELNKPDKNGNAKSVKRLLPITVVYQPQDNFKSELITTISISLSVFKSIKLEINIPVSYDGFKTSFFHELKHIWRQNFHQESFEDWLKDKRRYNIEKNISDNTDCIKEVIRIIYYVNPNEFNSYKENIYSFAYNSFLNNKTVAVQDVVNAVKHKFYYENKSISTIEETHEKYKAEVETYFLYLWMFNMKYDNQRVKYHIFSDNLKYTKEITNLLADYIKNDQREWRECVINSAKDSLFREDKEFVEELYKDGLSNIKKYIQHYSKIINKIVVNAYQDVKRDLSNDKKSEKFYYRYVSYNDDKTINIEIKLIDKKTDFCYYAIINGEHIEDILIRIYMIHLIYGKYINMFPVFRKIINLAKRMRYPKLKLKLNEIKYPEYNTLKRDASKIVDFINKVDLDKIL